MAAPGAKDLVAFQRLADAVAEWRRLAEAATAGPWVVDEGYGTSVDGTNSTVLYVAPAADRSSYIASLGSPIYGDHDAQFIAAARSAVPALLAELDRLQAELAELREAR